MKTIVANSIIILLFAVVFPVLIPVLVLAWAFDNTSFKENK